MASRTLAALGVAAGVLLSTLPVPVSAEKYEAQEFSWYKDYYPQPEAYCFQGCYTAVGYITYNVVPTSDNADDYYLNQCTNTPLIKSLFQCAQKYCTPEEAEAGRKNLNPSCVKVGHPLPEISEETLSQQDLDNVLVLNSTAGLATADAPLNTTAIPDLEWQRQGALTTDDFYINWDLGFDFSFALIAFWGLVVLVGMIHRASALMKKPSDGKQSSLWLWIRKTLILPATFGKHQAEAVAYTYTIPPRLESIILVVYLIMNIVFMFPGYNTFIGNQYYPAINTQLARYVADRSGFLAIAQLPMVWIFAARNDPFMWLTGWSFAMFNRFHRWIARISVLHAVIHSIAYTVFEFYSVGDASGYKESWTEEYWYCGGIATVAMCLILGASAYYFRVRYYDLFLIIHIGLSLIFFVTLWYHVRIFDGEFNYFLWPCIAIWGLDRLLRLGRTIFVSIMPRFTKGVKATATYHRTTEMVRMDITDFFPGKEIVPGHYYYMYMPSGLRGYESHPMTLCSWKRPGPSLPPSPTRTPDFNKEIEATVRRVSHDMSCTPELAHSFLIRPYKGMTGRLQQTLLSSSPSSSTATTTETIFLEGPYGSKLDLSHYSDLLVLCGGSGITAAISHTHYLLSLPTCTTRIHIIWAVPQRHLPDDICANELASVINDPRLKMTVYLTSAGEEEAQRDPEKLLPAEPPYGIRFGRPNLLGVMREERSNAERELAIVTCGTPQMSDACRAAVVEVLGEEGVDVGYYNETLVW